MNRWAAFLLVSTCVLLNATAEAKAAEFVRLPDLTRAAENTYTSGQHLIVTRYCYERGQGDAVLKYMGPGEYSGSRVDFQSGSHCEVKAVYERPSSSRKCNSRTGNSALDMLNNARCRDIEAQKFNQANAQRADQMQRQLNAQRAQLAQSRAASERRLSQIQAEAQKARQQANDMGRRNAEYKKFLNEFRVRGEAIAKIKNPSQRARAHEKLRKEAAVARAELFPELR